MAARFINLDRQTPMFPPCDLRDWVPAGHIVHFMFEAVEQIPTDRFRVNHRGSGLRGLEKVSLEWILVCVSYNLKRLFTLKNLPQVA